MKILLFIISICLLTQTAFTQTPSKEGMQEQMKKMVDGYNKQIADLEKQIAEAKKNKEDPEKIKQKEDNLNMLKKQVQTLGGLTKTVGGMSDRAISQATSEKENDNIKKIPKLDVARIKMIPERILTDKELIPYLKNVIFEVEKNISAKDKQIAEELKSGIVAKEKYNNALASVINMCWFNGYPEIATYLMGKLCLADMSNGNNLNNYSAFLVMSGAEHAAIPILQNLNEKYPGNSTILNNLGQAWFGLGEMTKAKKYLDETMHAYALHSQANLTSAKICMSQGHNTEAIESLKRSIRENYTGEKEAMLKEAGGELEYTDIPFPYPGPAKPLGIENFILTIPDYPMDGGHSAAELGSMWEDWKRKLRVASKKVSDELAQLAPKAKAYRDRTYMNSSLMKPYNNSIHNTALTRLTLLIGWADERTADLKKKLWEAEQEIDQWRQECTTQLMGTGGDGTTQGCQAKVAVARSFNAKANTIWHQRQSDYISFLKEYLGEWARLSLYSCTDRVEYEATIAQIKGYWLSELGELRCESEVGCLQTENPEVHSSELPDFDEMNCEYHDEIFIPPFTTMKFECNKMETNFIISPEFNYREGISPYLKFGWEENLNTGRIVKANVEIGGELGISAGHHEGTIFGPIRAEAKVDGGIGIEITEHGIEEVYIKGATRLDVGPYTSGHGHTLSEGNYSSVVKAETELSWNAGTEKVAPSLEGKFEAQGAKGYLGGIHISTGPIAVK